MLLPRAVLTAWLLATLGHPALAEDPRDVVFDCPCQAVWRADSTVNAGDLTLTFGLRSFRRTDSGELRLARHWPRQGFFHPAIVPKAAAPTVDPVPAIASTIRQRRAMTFDHPVEHVDRGLSRRPTILNRRLLHVAHLHLRCYLGHAFIERLKARQPGDAGIATEFGVPTRCVGCPLRFDPSDDTRIPGVEAAHGRLPTARSRHPGYPQYWGSAMVPPSLC